LLRNPYTSQDGAVAETAKTIFRMPFLWPDHYRGMDLFYTAPRDLVKVAENTKV
jgi:hypothetical protein